MPYIALSGTNIKSFTAKDHVNINKWGITQEATQENPTTSYGWIPGGTDDAYVSGTVYSSATTVHINGKLPILQGDISYETDSYTDTNEKQYASGKHTGSTAQGSVTIGNSKNVKIEKKLVAVVGSEVTSHTGTKTTLIDNNYSSNVKIT